MTAPRRPAAGRRPATSRGRAARTTARNERAGAPRLPARTAGTPASAPRRSGVTHRAAVLFLVGTTLVLSAALPLREFLDQRAEIAELQASASTARERVAALEEDKRRLGDPAHIAAEARRRLHMARPGEVTYVLLTPEPVPAAPDEPVVAGGPDDPWWSQVWGSVQNADRPPAPQDDAQAAVPPAPAP